MRGGSKYGRASGSGDGVGERGGSVGRGGSVNFGSGGGLKARRLREGKSSRWLNDDLDREMISFKLEEMSTSLPGWPSELSAVFGSSISIDTSTNFEFNPSLNILA